MSETEENVGSRERELDELSREAFAGAANEDQPAGRAATADNESSTQPGDVETMRAEVEKYRDLAMRSVADLDNFRKRMTREKEDAIKYANFGLLERLIPILDNFELGMQAARMDGNQSAILDGLSMVQKQLQDFLTSNGVEPIEAVGVPFDPRWHEAIAQEGSAKVPEGVVIRQLRKGYKLRDRLIRPANVVVSKGVAVEQPAGSTGG